MKVALCISGLPRSVEKCSKSIRQTILNRWDTDIFTYFWKENVEVRDGISILNYQREIEAAKDIYPAVVSREVSAPSLLDTYLEMHPFSEEEKRRIKGDKRRHSLSMFKAIYEVNKLKYQYALENHIAYDYVFRMRTDVSLRLVRPQKIELTDNSIVIPHREPGLVKGGYGDEFAWGPSHAMDYYSLLYYDFRKYQVKVEFWNPHQMLKWHLDSGPWPVEIMHGVDLRRRTQIW